MISLFLFCISPALVLAGNLASPEFPHPGSEFQDCDFCPVLTVVPAGSFMMGAAPDDQQKQKDEAPSHKVVIENSYAIGKFELTKGEYAKFVADTQHSSQGGCYFRTGLEPELEIALSWRNPGYDQDHNHPAVCVSWDDATAYVKWVSKVTGESYRLPSEAEWEYAARAGTASERYWGMSADDGCAYANGADLTGETDIPGWTVAKCHDGHSFTAAVGSLEPNKFGLHDVLGNVGEWVEDCWNETYEGAPDDGSSWRDGDCAIPILRGASWHDHPKFLRSANRYGFGSYGFNFDGSAKGTRYYNFGFRVVRNIN